jgi:hypothetical protein
MQAHRHQSDPVSVSGISLQLPVQKLVAEIWPLIAVPVSELTSEGLMDSYLAGRIGTYEDSDYGSGIRDWA